MLDAPQRRMLVKNFQKPSVPWRFIVFLAITAGVFAAVYLGMKSASAMPYPGCPINTGGTYNVCSENPGVPGFTPGFTLTPGVPGTWGPDGIYTPIQGNRIGGVVR